MCWVGRAAERCLDASSSVGGGDAPPPEPPPPGPTQCALEGPSPVCVRKSTWKKYVKIDFYQFFQEVPAVSCHSRRRFDPLQRLEVDQITGHHSVRGRGGVIEVLYKTQWEGPSEPSWEREMDLHLSRSHILRYWAGPPDQHRQTNRLYRRESGRHSASSPATTGNVS